MQDLDTFAAAAGGWLTARAGLDREFKLAFAIRRRTHK